MRRFLVGLSVIFFCNNALAVDKVLVEKAERKMYLLSEGKKIKEYDISLGFEPVGDKTRQGDGKTPEGVYKIIGRNPHSSYHKSLRVSYPDKEDIKSARARGVSPGGDIMIHGLPNGRCAIGRAHLLKDWTLGCIAVTCEEIEEIWKLVKDRTIVEILP